MFPPNPQTKKYDLRWRFDFAGRPPKWGKWSSPGNSNETKASHQNAEGLVRASIEGKNVFNPGDVRILAECNGQDFVNFQWSAIAITPAMFKGTVKPVHALVGMKLLTRDELIEVAATGEIAKRPRTDGEKRINFATFGR